MKTADVEVPPVYYPAFDVLRFVLATAVAATHSNLLPWSMSGDFAVHIFFALSGWLIGGILLKSTPADLPRFYFNRASRIWIPYVIAVLLLMAVSLTRDRVTWQWLAVFFYNFTFVYDAFANVQFHFDKAVLPLQGTGHHFWSICAEEQFYLAAPLLIMVLPRRLGTTIWFWAMLATVMMLLPTWQYFGAISLGVLAAIAQARLGDWHADRQNRAVVAGLAAVGLIAVVTEIVPYRVGGPITAILIVLALAQRGRQSKFAAMLGGISYPMYLNHWIGVFAANAVFAKFDMRDTFVCRLAGVLAAIAIATALYFAIDRVVMTNRARYFDAARGKVLAAMGFGLVSVGLLGGLVIGALAP